MPNISRCGSPALTSREVASRQPHCRRRVQGHLTCRCRRTSSRGCQGTRNSGTHVHQSVLQSSVDFQTVWPHLRSCMPQDCERTYVRAELEDVDCAGKRPGKQAHDVLVVVSQVLLIRPRLLCAGVVRIVLLLRVAGRKHLARHELECRRPTRSGRGRLNAECWDSPGPRSGRS